MTDVATTPSGPTPGHLLVVGAGAIGGVTAALLTGHVERVTVLDTDAHHVALISNRGLVLDDGGRRTSVRLEALTELDALDQRADAALLLVKAAALPAVVSRLVERDLAESYVSLGNGLVQDVVAALCGEERLIAGVVEWGATSLGPGHVARTSRGAFVLGERDGCIRDRTRRVAAMLEHAAPVTISARIGAHLWAKLLANSTFSGLGAVAGLPGGAIAAHDPGHALTLAVWQEGYRVARAEGVEPAPVAGVAPRRLAEGPDAQRRAGADELVARLGATRSSMLQDLERGARTEVDVINGGVVATAARHGLAAPLNAAITTLVHAIERGERRPEPGALAALRAIAAGRTA